MSECYGLASPGLSMIKKKCYLCTVNISYIGLFNCRTNILDIEEIYFVLIYCYSVSLLL